MAIKFVRGVCIGSNASYYPGEKALIEKALMIIIFMYASSYSILAAQYVIGDVIRIDLTTYEGVEIKSHVLSFINEGQLNAQILSISEGNFTGNTTYYDKVETSTTSAAYVAWELVQLLTGTYIFNFMYLMGIPLYFVSIFVILYMLLLARAIIGLIRGI